MTTPDDKVFCDHCKNEIDPDVCHCGESMESHHGMSHNHSPVPMGCTCGYILPVTRNDFHSADLGPEYDKALDDWARGLAK